MYATADDMRARFGETHLAQLADAAVWDGVAIAAINLAIGDASALADGYVAKYYAPAAGIAVPALLVRLVCDIAYANLNRQPTDEATKRADKAIATLRDISKGLVKLDEGRADIPARAGAVIVPDRERTFSRDSLGAF